MSDPGGSFQQPQPPTPEPSQFQTFGAPQPGYVPWSYPAPAQQRSRFPVWAIVILACAGGLVMVLVLAAVAIPVFLNQRNKSAAAGYTVSTPDQVDGFSRSTVGRAKTAIDATMGSLSPAEAARTTALVYTDSSGTIRVLVVVEKRVVPVGQVDDAIAGEEHGFGQSTGTSLRFDPVSTGSLGGQMECSVMDARRSVCMFANAGSFGSVILANPQGGEAGAAALRVLQAVLHRS